MTHLHPGATDVTHTSLRALFAALALVALAGCSSSLEQPVAEIGDRSVTVDDFVRIARGNEQQYPGDAAAAKDSLLRDLLIREAMLIAAKSQGYFDHPTALQFRRSVENEAMQRELRDMLAPVDVGVSEAELREMHRWRSHKVHVKVVYTLDEPSIHAAAYQLAQGEPFESVADRWNFPGVVGPGGDVGWATPGQLMQPLDNALLQQPLGGIAGPFRTSQGWFLLHVLDRQPQEQMPFELQRPGLEQLVRQRKQREVFTREVEAIKRGYAMQPVFASTQRVYQILRDGLQPTEEVLREALVTWRGGQYTVADLMQDLNDPASDKPPASMMPAIEVWLETRALSRVLQSEAERRHLMDAPRVRREVQDQFHNHITQSIYADITGSAGPATEADVRAIWEHMKEQYIRLEHADIEWIELADSALASSIAKHGGHAASMQEALTMNDASLTANAEHVRFPTQDARWAALEAMFIRMQPGEWSGPERVADGWRLLRMTSKQQVAQDFEKLPPPLRENLVRAADELRRDRYFVAFADSVQQAVGVKRFPKRLASIPWPLPPPIKSIR